MPYVLLIWLKEVPQYTTALCCSILIFSLVYQYSMGLMSAIQATGHIKNYQITMGILILMNIPFSYFVLKVGMPPYFTTIGFIIIELLSLIIRILFARHLVGIRVRDYLQKVIMPTVCVMVISCTIALIPHFIMDDSFSRLIIVCLMFLISSIISSWLFALDNSEKTIFANIINNVLHRKIIRNENI